MKVIVRNYFAGPLPDPTVFARKVCFGWKWRKHFRLGRLNVSVWWAEEQPPIRKDAA